MLYRWLFRTEGLDIWKTSILGGTPENGRPLTRIVFENQRSNYCALEWTEKGVEKRMVRSLIPQNNLWYSVDLRLCAISCNCRAVIECVLGTREYKVLRIQTGITVVPTLNLTGPTLWNTSFIMAFQWSPSVLVRKQFLRMIGWEEIHLYLGLAADRPVKPDIENPKPWFLVIKSRQFPYGEAVTITSMNWAVRNWSVFSKKKDMLKAWHSVPLR